MGMPMRWFAKTIRSRDGYSLERIVMETIRMMGTPVDVSVARIPVPPEYSPEDGGETERLIVAAPELLEMLEMLLSEYEALLLDDHRPAANEIMTGAEALIARVRGK
jgi:hypothetical protein